MATKATSAIPALRRATPVCGDATRRSPAEQTTPAWARLRLRRARRHPWSRLGCERLFRASSYQSRSVRMGESLALSKMAKLGDSMMFSCRLRSEEHTSELQSLMRNSYAVFCLKKKNTNHYNINNHCCVRSKM